MSRQTFADLVSLVFAVAVSRFLFRTHQPYLLDSINFTLGVTAFDPVRHQPHPPGYYLYILAARVLRFIWGDPHTALVALSVLASCGVAVLIYLLAAQWFDRRAALFAGILFVASPLGWFHGGIALVYIVEMFFSALVGLLCWRNLEMRGSTVFSSAIVLGLSGGVRQSSFVFLCPLWLLSIRRAGTFRILVSIGLLAATLLVWALPMAAASGGLMQYWDALENLWRRAGGRELAAYQPLSTTLVGICFRALWVAAAYLLTLGTAAPLPLMRRWPGGLDAGKRLFCAIWIAPGLLFFVLIFMRLVNAGYLLFLLPPVFAVVGASAAEWFDESSSVSCRGRYLVVAAFALVNVAIFFLNPIVFSYGRIRADARETVEYIDIIRQVASPKDTLLIGVNNHIHGARHAGYFLPEFLSLEWPEFEAKSGIRVSVMRDRQVALLPRLPVEGFKRFVYFPPGPIGPKSVISEYGGVNLPPGALRVQKIRGIDVFIGSTTDLWRIFPKMSSKPDD